MGKVAGVAVPPAPLDLFLAKEIEWLDALNHQCQAHEKLAEIMSRVTRRWGEGEGAGKR
jgi:hypothetical protein